MLNLLIKNKGNHIKVSLVWPLAQEFIIIILPMRSNALVLYSKSKIGGKQQNELYTERI